PRPSTSTSVTMMGPNGGVVSMFTAGGGAMAPPPPPIPDGPTLSGTLAIAVGDSDASNLTVTLAAGPRVSGRIDYDGTRDPLSPDQLIRVNISLEPADGRTFFAAVGRAQFDAN